MSDYDGDIVLSIDNPTFLKCKFYDEFNNLPITYSKSTVPKMVVKEKDLYKADLKSFDTKIGQITNYSTAFYSLLHKFDNDNSEYAQKCRTEILKRLKLTRYAQGQEIDHAKGVQTDPYPKHWITRTPINDTDPIPVKEHKQFLNDICADKKPDFFKYRYYTSKYDYNDFESAADLYSIIRFSKHLNELNPALAEETDYIQNYIQNQNLLQYNSEMNAVSRYMVQHLSPLKKQGALINRDIVDLLKRNANATIDPFKLQYIKELADRYYEQKTMFRRGIEEEYTNLDQVAKKLREEALERFETTEELADYVVEVCYVQRYHQSKSFAWNVFGKFLLDNLTANTQSPPRVPVWDPNGEINYLFERYTLMDVIVPNEDGESDDTDIQ